MEALLEEAERMGVRVLFGKLGDRNGVYYHDLKMIIIDQGLTPGKERFTLAHELGHAHHGHYGSSVPNEMRADEYAAKLMVCHEEYKMAESISESPAFIAGELGISLRLVEAYARNMARNRT